MNFLYNPYWMPVLKELQESRRSHRVVFVVRPAELDPGSRHSTLHEINGPEGTIPLWIAEEHP